MVQLPVFDQIPDFKVMGILSQPANARKTAEKFGIPKAYETLEQLVLDPAVQLVNICAPNHLHCELALSAFEHGKDVICIKPLASNLAEAKEMVQAAERSACRLFYAENVNFIPALSRLERDGGRRHLRKALSHQSMRRDWASRTRIGFKIDN